MQALQAFIGLQAVWQVELLAGTLLRVGALLFLAFALAPLVARRDRTRVSVVWRVALVAALLLPAVPSPSASREVGLPIGAVLARVDNGVPLKGARAVGARWLGANEASGARFAAGNERGATGPGLFAWILAAWCAGSAFLLLRTLVGARRLSRVLADASPVDDGAIRLIADDTAAAIGLRKVPRLVLSPSFELPVTFGVINPKVVLPPSALDWSRDRLAFVLRHELAHVARRDWLWQMFARAACIVHWFNPLAWMAARRQHVAAEMACDQKVLADGAAPEYYARELVAMAASSHQVRGTGRLVMAFTSRDELGQRVQALLDPRPAAPRAGMALQFTVVALAMLMPVLLAFRPSVGACLAP